MITKITHEHAIGDIVYLITDVEQKPRMVVGIGIGIHKNLYYTLACGTNESVSSEMEITSEKVIY